MKKLFSITFLTVLIVSSFTAEARGHRGGSHHSSGRSYSSYSHNSYAPAPVKKKPARHRAVRYAAAGAVGYGAYQAHNYVTSYTRESGRQAARNRSIQRYQSQEQMRPEPEPVSTAPTCAPLALARDPGYTRLPICSND